MCKTTFLFRPRQCALAVGIACALGNDVVLAADSFLGLGTLGGTNSWAEYVSADGAVVVGDSQIAGNTASHAFRWTGGVMSDLGTLGGTNSSIGYQVSTDGAVLVGDSQIAGNTASHAFRWTGGAMSDLGTLGGTNSRAWGVSADGAVVVGDSDIAGNTAFHAFRWTGGMGMVDLGTLGGGSSLAYQVSTDGAVVVGYSQIAGNTAFHAFRWTGGVMSDLGTLGGNSSVAYHLSADGAVVVGYSQIAGNMAQSAFRWTRANGMQSVSAWLAGAGVVLPAGWALTAATATNRDGSLLVGYSTNPAGNSEAWVARLGGILLDIPAYNATLIETGSRAVQGGVNLPNLALFGAHHRSLLDSGLARTRDGACAWATADAAGYHSINGRTELAEAGACKDIGSIRLGLGVGQEWARQDWTFGGGAKYDGQYLIGEAGNVFANGIQGSLTGYYGRFNTDLRRNYMNGATVDSSTGKPNANSAALRLRVDWKDVTSLKQFSLSPYAAYTVSQTKLDAYTETGGGFPAQFAAARWTDSDLRAGMAGKTALSGATDLRLGLEAVQRLEKSTSGVNGQIIGLWSFSQPGQTVKQTWARATVDLDHRLSNATCLTFGANAATRGSDASWGVTAGVRANF